MSRESENEKQLRIKRMADADIDSVLSGLTNLSLQDEETKSFKIMPREGKEDINQTILPPGMTWNQFHDSINIELGLHQYSDQIITTPFYKLVTTYVKLGEFQALSHLMNIQIRNKKYPIDNQSVYNNVYSKVIRYVVEECIKAGNVDAVDLFVRFPFEHPDIGQSEYVVYSIPVLFDVIQYTLESNSVPMFHYLLEKFRQYEEPHENKIRDVEILTSRFLLRSNISELLFNCILQCGNAKTFNLALKKMGQAWMESMFTSHYYESSYVVHYLFRGCNFTGKPNSFDMFIMTRLQFVEPIALHKADIPLECEEAAVRLYGPAFEATILHIDKRISRDGFRVCPFNIHSAFQGDGKNKKWTSVYQWRDGNNGVSYCYKRYEIPATWADAPKRAFFHCIVNPTHEMRAIEEGNVVVPTTPSPRKFENHEVLCVFHINYSNYYEEDETKLSPEERLLKPPDEKTAHTYEAYVVPFMRNDKAFRKGQRFDRPTIEMVAMWTIVYNQEYKDKKSSVPPSEMMAKSWKFLHMSETDFYHYAKAFEKIDVTNQSFTMVRVAFFEIEAYTYNSRMTSPHVNQRNMFMPIQMRNPFDKWSDPKYDNEKFGERNKTHRQDMEELTQLLDAM